MQVALHRKRMFLISLFEKISMEMTLENWKKEVLIGIYIHAINSIRGK